MSEDKNIKIRFVMLVASTALMVVTVLLQMVAFDILRHIALSSVIIALESVILFYDYKLTDKFGAIMRGGCIILWIFNIVINIFNV